MSVRYVSQRWSMDRLRLSLLLMAAASLGAAAIHAAVVPEHLEEAWPFGLFFIACAVFQVAWAGLVVLRPSTAVYGAGIVANGAMVAIWAVSRTTGLPVGPELWTAEAVGALDLVATGLELLLIALAVWALKASNAGRGSAG